MNARTRKAVAYGAVLYTIFVIYGSLVPFNYTPRSTTGLWDQFIGLLYTETVFYSRTDWATNLLLFIPLAFLWLGLLWPQRNGWARIVTSAVVLIGCLLLGSSIEFVQMFFSGRTTSIYDIRAQLIGTVIGVAGGLLFGPKLFALWEQPQSGKHQRSAKLFWAYLAGLVIYNLMPLDLTISPVELYHKWSEGRMVLIPFSFAQDIGSQQVYDWLADIALWVPLAALACLCFTTTSIRRIFGLLLGLAVGIELLQVFVFSRISDTTDILLAVLGSGLGLALGHWLRQRSAADENHYIGESTSELNAAPSNNTVMLGLLGAGLWTLVLVAVFWYPYDFVQDQSLFLQRLQQLSRAPFSSYFFSSELLALTEILRKIIFFLPLGITLAMLLRPLIQRNLTGFATLITLIAGLAVAGGIELGQLLLPSKSIDSADVFFATLGTYMGFLLFNRLIKSPPSDHPRLRPIKIAQSEPSVARIGYRPLIIYSAIFFLMVWLSSWLLRASFIPYNVRELFDKHYPFISALLLWISLLWIFGIPVAIAAWLQLGRWYRTLLLPALIILHGAISYTVLRAAVPLESLHDILGSPVLDWGWEWERMVRFIALSSVPVVVLSGIATLKISWYRERLMLGTAIRRWFFPACLLLFAAHWVVVKEAATDNLTELMLNNGGWIATLLLIFWLAISGWSGTAIGAKFAGWQSIKLGLLRMTLIALSIPLSYQIAIAATEPMIIKYGQAYSALQFLLSSDRSHYAGPDELALRYGLAYVGLIIVIAVAQFPFWLWAIQRYIGPQKMIQRTTVPRHRIQPRLRVIDNTRNFDEEFQPPDLSPRT